MGEVFSSGITNERRVELMPSAPTITSALSTSPDARVTEGACSLHETTLHASRIEQPISIATSARTR